MWSTISALKKNITSIASDVLDTAEELESDTPYDSTHQGDPSFDPTSDEDDGYIGNQRPSSAQPGSPLQQQAASLSTLPPSAAATSEVSGLLPGAQLTGSSKEQGSASNSISSTEGAATPPLAPPIWPAGQANGQHHFQQQGAENGQRCWSNGPQANQAVTPPTFGDSSQEVYTAARAALQGDSSDGHLVLLAKELAKKEVERALEAKKTAELQALTEQQRLKANLTEARQLASRAEDAAALLKEQLRSCQGQAQQVHELKERLSEAESREASLAAELENSRLQLEQQRERYSAEKTKLEAKLAQRAGSSQQQQHAEVEALKQAHEGAMVKTRSEKEKLARDLARLKEHLLSIETEESEKAELEAAKQKGLQQRIDEQHTEILALQLKLSELRASLETSRQMEAAAEAKGAEKLSALEAELVALREERLSLQAVTDAKEEELGNLQAALGQFYAESEAKNNLASELRAAREEVAHLTKDLEDARAEAAKHQTKVKAAEERAEEAEDRLVLAKERQKKWETETGRLRKALDESMMRLNQLSIESGFYVDRRIVVKLLLTYFERQHSKDALDLMVKMLGFSADEKRRIEEAARLRASSGGVRGVLNFPGRFMGGFLSKADHPDDPSETRSAQPPREGVSFSDMWIEFLLKESEERDRRDRDAAVLQHRQSDKGVGFTGAGVMRAGSPRNSTSPLEASPDHTRGPESASLRSPGSSPRFFSGITAPQQSSPTLSPDKAHLGYDLTITHRSRPPSPTAIAHEAYDFRPQIAAAGHSSAAGRRAPSIAVSRTSTTSPGKGPLVPLVSAASSPATAPLAVKSSITGMQSTLSASRGPPDAYISRHVNGPVPVSRGERDDSSETSGGDFSPVPLHGNSSGEGPSLFDSFRRINKNKEEAPLPL